MYRQAVIKKIISRLKNRNLGDLEANLAERFAAGRARYKVYADKIYDSNLLVTATYGRRHNRHGLHAWQTRLDRLMSDIRVGVEWSFGTVK